MSLIFDLHSSEIKFSDPSPIKLALGRSLDVPFSVNTQEIQLIAGMETHIQVEASEREASESFRKLKFGGERKCRLEEERDVGSSMFKFYSQKSCRYVLCRV